MLISAMGYGSTGAITRNIDATAWQIASWRALGGGAVLFSYVVWRGRRARPRLRIGAAFSPTGLLLAGLGAVSMIMFISALQRTAVANVSVITATIPFVAAGLAWLVLRERLRALTVLAAVVSFAGVLITVVGSIEASNLDGALRAVVLTVTLALLIVLIRHFDRRGSGVDAVLAMSVAGALLFCVALVVGDPFGVDAGEAPLLAMFAAIFGASTVMWVEGVKLIPAAEAGLLAAAEAPFGIVLAWIVLAEAPTVAAVIGGVMVLGAVAGHAGTDLARNRVSKPWLRPRARPRV